MNYEIINNIKLNDYSDVKEIFPKITVSYLPQEILVMLKRMYAGNKSEFTAITQYTYQSFVLWRDIKLSNVSSIMEQIAKCKMMHYEVLAKILVKCGIDPKNCVYIDGNPNLCDFWKASSVVYEKSLVKMFESNLALEQRQINEYKEIVDKTDNENLKDIIQRMIQDEDTHLIYFNSVLSELKK